LTPLFRRGWLLVTTFLIAIAVVCLVDFIVPAQFSSHMAILVNRERLDPLVTPGIASQMVSVDNPVSEDEINSEAELLTSRDVLQNVVLTNRLQNAQDHSFTNMFHFRETENDRIERAVRLLASNLKIATKIKTNIIDVSYSSSDPRVAYGVLSSLANLYLEKHVAVHRPPGSSEFFAEETTKYHQALEESETRLKQFEEIGTAAPDLERSNLAVQITNSIGQMHAAEQAIAADGQRIRSDRQQMQVTPERSATRQDTTSANLLLQNLGSSLLAAETKRAQLVLRYDPGYPLVREADQEIVDAKAAIAEARANPYINQETDRDPTFELLREDLAKTGSDLAAQKATLIAVKQSIQDMQHQMIDLDQRNVTQQDLLRDVKANEDNYLLYLSKREQERTSDALDKTRIANVAIAVPPAVPALPTHGLLFYVLGGLVLASLLAIAVAYFTDYFDSSFHVPAQVTETLGIPIVVSISKRTA
jgi:uncharacterized protein involved in exopolysaccharide biosynthesis